MKSGSKISWILSSHQIYRWVEEFHGNSEIFHEENKFSDGTSRISKFSHEADTLCKLNFFFFIPLSFSLRGTTRGYSKCDSNLKTCSVLSCSLWKFIRLLCLPSLSFLSPRSSKVLDTWQSFVLGLTSVRRHVAPRPTVHNNIDIYRNRCVAMVTGRTKFVKLFRTRGGERTTNRAVVTPGSPRIIWPY